MSEQENQKPTLIPPNFIEKGKIFGGMFDIRNAIEGGVIAALITYPVLQLPFSVTVRIIILCMTALPLFMISLIGSADHLSVGQDSGCSRSKAESEIPQ